MVDRAKLLKALSCCSNKLVDDPSEDPHCPDDCPYINYIYCESTMADDVLELLKELEFHV